MHKPKFKFAKLKYKLQVKVTALVQGGVGFCSLSVKVIGSYKVSTGHFSHKRRSRLHQQRVICLRFKVVQSEVEDQREDK